MPIDAACLTVKPTVRSTHDYCPEETAFLKAVDAYRTANDRRFPSNTEIFRLVKSLGYRKP